MVVCFSITEKTKKILIGLSSTPRPPSQKKNENKNEQFLQLEIFASKDINNGACKFLVALIWKQAVLFKFQINRIFII